MKSILIFKIILILLIVSSIGWSQDRGGVVEIYTLTAGTSQDSVRYWMEAMGVVWDQDLDSEPLEPQRLTDNFYYLYSTDSRVNTPRGVPVPYSGDYHGFYCTTTFMSGVTPDSVVFGYSKYKLSIGFNYTNTIMYFYLDWRDCDYPNYYSCADIWIKFDVSDSTLEISWEDEDFNNPTVVERDEHPTFNIWDYKLKDSLHTDQNTDQLELYLVVTTQNEHPYLTWNAYNERTGNNNVDYYEVWKKESSSWSLKDTTSNTYYEDTSEDATAPGIKSYVYYKIRAVELDADSSLFGNQVKKAVYNPTQDTKIEPVTDNSISRKPTVYALKQNYPNPFNPSTTISFDLPKESTVQLQIFDIRGKLVSALLNEKLDRGMHSVSFNATDLPSGVYFYRLKTVGFTDIRRMLFLK